MNGAQDLGGMMGFGPVQPEAHEPVFHADWERRAFAITLASGFCGQWNIDMARSARESLSPAQYLASSYYEIWFEGLRRLLVARGMVGADELESGHALRASEPGISAVPRERVAAVLARGGPTERAAIAPARFALGQSVRTRNLNPSGHVRLPRYARDKVGTVVALHGSHVFPDTNARGEGESPQWLYTVAFSGQTLWGEHSTADSVRVDCWEPYLMAVETPEGPSGASADGAPRASPDGIPHERAEGASSARSGGST
ncbi:MAG: nitrile hydratase subunit beta [Burkholderiaceae bacterium]|nr:nitrile hydratase subunit beta [Burkholderiaceae bacterium]